MLKTNTEDLKMKNYRQSYLKAIDHPLPELQATFNKEIDILKKLIKPTDRVLDVGCGAGRPAIELGDFCAGITGIDNDPGIIEVAETRKGTAKCIFLVADASELPFETNHFDAVYCTYNTIGSIPKSQSQKIVDEMYRVLKPGGWMYLSSWDQSPAVLDFLQGYYPSIGMEVLSADLTKTVTDKGTAEKVSVREMNQYSERAGFKDLYNLRVGELWMAVVGRK